MKRRKKHRRAKAGRLMISTALIITAFLICLLVFEAKVVGPNMEDVAAIRASSLVSRTVSRALAEEFTDRRLGDSLFTEKRSRAGTLEMVQANSVQINLMMSKLSVSLQDEFSRMKGEKLSVSMGTLVGSRFLSQAEPGIKLRIVPLSVSSMDFRTEFETQGINQTKYKIYVVIACRVKVLAPISSRVINTESTVLIAETVILGKVPNSYVQVPEDGILDVT